MSARELIETVTALALGSKGLLAMDENTAELQRDVQRFAVMYGRASALALVLSLGAVGCVSARDEPSTPPGESVVARGAADIDVSRSGPPIPSSAAAPNDDRERRAEEKRRAVDSFSPQVIRAQGMTRARVQEALGGRADVCRSQLLERWPYASGEIAFDIRVSPRGTTLAIDLLRDDVNDAELAACIRRVVLPVVWGDAGRDGATASVSWSVVAPGTNQP